VTTIFHIAESPAWDAAVVSGTYQAPSLSTEGFIHLSTRDQFVATATRYYAGRTDLVLLEVDEEALPPGELRYEPSTGGELFPHLFAPLPVAAVLRVHTFLPGEHGEFHVPDTVLH
jgi:uncharacterized protein (DUF952 family)